ncbi:MAG TPA: multiheme c-type cytochrome, partial [Calditrichia bacterium]|nr:multiheme c-type cytochrome [Calditrichia bacterium]
MNRIAIALILLSFVLNGQDLWRKETLTFASSGLCYDCHAPGLPNQQALKTPDGRDVSPINQWRATMMANSFRDPYYQAKITAEVTEHPHLQAIIEDECLTCHAPMARTEVVNADSTRHYTFTEAKQDTMAWDGVSCTVCHQINPGNLGTPESWSGHYEIVNDRLIYGPYDNMLQQPMVTVVHYLPVQGLHIRESELCATCHTLFTPSVDDNGQIIGSFPEQTPYLEWKNSDYPAAGQGCQSCHFPEVGVPITISNRPMGLPAWAPYGQHFTLGGNFFMLEMFKNHGTELGVTATTAQFDSLIAMTRRFLSEKTATLTLDEAEWDGDDSLSFSLRVTNLAGHKFPTAYPSRRAWLRVEVLESVSGNSLFLSGAWDPATGEIDGLDSLYEPHYDVIRDAGQVQIYEGVIGDVNGEPTHGLLRAVSYLKDNRLPPAGYVDAGIYADSTGIRGLATNDPNFNRENGVEGSGSDAISFKIGGLSPGLTYRLKAALVFQPVMPNAVAYLNRFSSPEITRFNTFWDQADKSPQVIDSLSAMVSATGLSPETGVVPESGMLVSAYPNPFNPEVTFAINLPANGTISGAVYSLLGQKV